MYLNLQTYSKYTQSSTLKKIVVCFVYNTINNHKNTV